MAYYLDHSPLAFFGMKYLLTCASIIVILMVKDFYLFKSRVQGKVIFVFHLIVLTSVVQCPSAALPSSLVTAAYFYVRLIPRDFGSLAFGHFPSASQKPLFR
jgi:hypothetical protein